MAGINFVNENEYSRPLKFAKQEAKIDLRYGDCLEIMKDIPANSIDAIITDPPYGVSYQSNMPQ